VDPEQIAELHHQHHAQYTEDMPLWLALAQEATGRTLELGCGTGRVLLALADAGIEVVGVDHDAAMLSVLRRQLKAQPRANMSVIEGDFTEAAVSGEFPLIIMPCNTYSTLDADMRQKTLARVKTWLAPGGRFVASLPNPALLAELEAESEPEMELALDDPATGATLSVSSGWAREDGWLRFDWVYDLLHPDGRVERGTASTRHELAGWTQLAGELEDAGFRVDAWGDHTRKAFDADQDANLIFCAQCV
jgi:SAM-dependent methyltransferase